jgi:uncharacterized protein
MIHQFNSRAGSYFSLFSFALVTSLLLFSCKGPKAAVGDTEKLPNALLWKITHKDNPQPSYLFGTIHMIPKEDFFLPSGLEEAFDKSRKVVFEIDLDDMSDMGSLMGMMSGLMMKDGMTLKKLLKPDEYQEVSDYFEAMGLPMFLLGNVKPMFLSMLAEVNMDPEAMQSEEIVSYEMELYDKANQSSKEVGGLETMAYQMSLFDSIPYKDQADMLLDAVRGTNTESDMFEETLELYKHQDIEAMVSMVSESEEAGSGNYEDVLLNNRNHNWIPVMAKKMKTGSIFFAVGAGHLGGEQGVIRLLRKAGYEVTPVSVYKEVAPKRV